MASKSTIEVKILGDNKGLAKSLGASQSMIGGWAGSVGKLAVLGVAAVGAAGVAAATGLFKVGQSFDTEFDKIRVGTGATGDALVGLQDSFKNVLSTVPASFGDAGSAIADLNTRLELTGKPLEDLAGQFINLSRITKTDVAANVDNLTRTFGDWGVSTEDQAATLDKLYRASQASGIGIDELSQSIVTAGAPLRNLGFSLDESAALLAQFNKTGVNTDTVIAGLKAGVGKLAKAGEPVPETFSRIVDEITAMGPGTEATGLAIELFGQRAGPDMADAIAGGKFAIDDMLAAIQGGTDTINGAAADTASFSEKWLMFKNKVLVGLEPLATKVFDAVGDAMDDIGPKVEPIIGWFAVAIPRAVETVRPIAQSVMAAIVTASTAVVQWFQTNWPTIQATIQTLVDFFQTKALPIIQEVIGFIVTTFGEMKAWVDVNWPAIQETISGVIEAIKVIIDTTTQIITAIWETHGERILSFISTVWDTIKTVIDAAITVVRGVINTVTSLIRGDWEGVWNGIKTILSGVWDGMKALVSAAVDAVKLTITLALDGIRVAWFAVWGAIATFIDQKWEAIKGFVRSGVDALVGFVKGIPGSIASAASGAFDAIWTNFKQVINRVVDAWNNLSLPGFTIGGWDPPGPGPSFPSITIPSVGTPNIPRLASGGLAFSPMLAMVGDNRNARRDPEVIAPGSMISQIVRTELDRGGRGASDRPITLVIEGRPFSAMIQSHEAAQVAELMAGVR